MNSDLTGDESAALDVTGMIGQYAHGNEPGHHVPYLYNHVGQYHKTQALVDSICIIFTEMNLMDCVGMKMWGKCRHGMCLAQWGFIPYARVSRTMHWGDLCLIK